MSEKGPEVAHKNPEQRAATRRKIMSAYIDLYKVQPREAITASAVIAKAAVNRSTFYDYFDSMASLQRAVEDDLLAAMHDTAKNALVPDGDLDITALVSQTYANHGELIGLMIGENGSASFIARAKDSLKPLVDKALPSAMPDAERPYIAEFVTSGLIALYARWYSSGKDLPLAELAPFAQSLVLSCLDGRRDSQALQEDFGATERCLKEDGRAARIKPA